MARPSASIYQRNNPTYNLHRLNSRLRLAPRVRGLHANKDRYAGSCRHPATGASALRAGHPRALLISGINLHGGVRGRAAQEAGAV
jgi:hypothetical protein